MVAYREEWRYGQLVYGMALSVDNGGGLRANEARALAGAVL